MRKSSLDSLTSSFLTHIFSFSSAPLKSEVLSYGKSHFNFLRNFLEWFIIRRPAVCKFLFYILPSMGVWGGSSLWFDEHFPGAGVWMETALSLWISSGRNGVLTTSRLAVHKQSKGLHLFRSSLVSLSKVLWFSVYSLNNYVQFCYKWYYFITFISSVSY